MAYPLVGMDGFRVGFVFVHDQTRLPSDVRSSDSPPSPPSPPPSLRDSLFSERLTVLRKAHRLSQSAAGVAYSGEWSKGLMDGCGELRGAAGEEREKRSEKAARTSTLGCTGGVSRLAE